MEPLVAIASVAAVAGIVLVTQYALRLVVRGDSRFVWLAFPPPLLTGGALLWIALGMWAYTPLLALFVGAAGLVQLVLTARLLFRLSSVVKSAVPGADAGDLMTGPISDFMLAYVAIGLMVGVLGGIGLVVLAILGRL